MVGRSFTDSQPLGSLANSRLAMTSRRHHRDSVSQNFSFEKAFIRKTKRAFRPLDASIRFDRIKDLILRLPCLVMSRGPLAICGRAAKFTEWSMFCPDFTAAAAALARNCGDRAGGCDLEPIPLTTCAWCAGACWRCWRRCGGGGDACGCGPAVAVQPVLCPHAPSFGCRLHSSTARGDGEAVRATYNGRYHGCFSVCAK